MTCKPVIARTMPRVRKIGYQAAQIPGLGPIDPAELRKIMLDAGVKPIGTHVGVEAFQNDLPGVIRQCGEV